MLKLTNEIELRRFSAIALLASLFFTFASAQELPNLSTQEAQIMLRSGSFYNLVDDVEQQYFEEFGIDGDRGGSGYKPFKRAEWYWRSRLTPTGDIPSTGLLQNLYREFQVKQQEDNLKVSAEKNATMKWESLGPVGIPQTNNQFGKLGNGRINVLTIDPKNDNIMYAGAAGGGVWKSINGGSTWEQLRYDDFLALSVSHIAIDPNDSNVLYVATGDINTVILRNGGASGSNSGYNLPSIGVLKSTDGGQSWNMTGYQTNNGAIGPRGTDYVSTIIVHPDNSNRVILGTDDGLYESLNGGASFTRIAEGTFRDIKLNPVRKNLIHCALSDNNSNVYRLINFDLNAKNYSSNPFNINSCIRVELAVSADRNGSVVYAIAGSTSRKMRGFYKSTDAGSNWQQIGTNNRDLLVRDVNGNPGDNGQAEYDLAIDVNPTNADEVFIGGINVWKTLNGGQSFQISTFWTHQYVSQGLDAVHADIHYIKFNSDGSKVYAANDGGISVSSDDGNNWTDITSNLVTTQYYDISVDRRNGDTWILGGSQDNGTSLMTGNGWQEVFGGDGMRTQVALEDNHMYFSQPNGRLYRYNLSTGQTAIIGGIGTGLQGNEPGEWVTPFILSPHDPKVIYAGYNNIWKSENRGSSWQNLTSSVNLGNSLIDDIVVAPSDPNTIYFCVSGNNSFIFKTTNGGQSWSTVSQGGNTVSGFVQDLAVDPVDPNTFYYTVGGFSTSNKIWKVTGNSFSNISNGLPNFSVNAVYIDKAQNRVFAGTDVGVYVKEGSSSFAPFKSGMPNCVISDFEVPKGQTELYAGTYGSGAWKVPLLDCSGLTAPEISAEGSTTLCPGDSVKLTYSGFGTVEWNTGENSKSIWAKQAGDYFAIKTDSKGCSATSEIIEVQASSMKTPFIAGVPADNKFCSNDSVRLIAGGGIYDRYEWNGVEGDRIFWVKEPGDYTVTVYDDDEGCSATSTTVSLEMLLAPNTPTLKYENNVLISSFGSSYKWYLNGSVIPGATSRQYKPIVNGDYMVEIFTAQGCGAISEPFNITDTYVRPIALEESVIFPNPSDGNFTVRNLPSMEEYRLDIFSLEGSLVYSQSSISSNSNLSVELASGNYMLRFISDDKVYTTTLTIK